MHKKAKGTCWTEMLSATDVAKKLNVSRQTIWNWTKGGLFPAFYTPSLDVYLYAPPDVKEAIKYRKKHKKMEKHWWYK